MYLILTWIITSGVLSCLLFQRWENPERRPAPYWFLFTCGAVLLPLIVYRRFHE